MTIAEFKNKIKEGLTLSDARYIEVESYVINIEPCYNSSYVYVGVGQPGSKYVKLASRATFQRALMMALEYIEKH